MNLNHEFHEFGIIFFLDKHIFRQHAAQYMIWLCPSVSSVTFVKKNLCVRSLGYIVGASPPFMKICVSVRWGILWVRPPLLWILACCLLRFAAFFKLGPTKIAVTRS